MKGKPVLWSNVSVHYILTTRAVLGEYIPYKTHRGKPAGKAVPGYYPAVIDEETFYAAQAALKVRAAVGRGRRGKHVNLFAGLLRDARTGCPLSYRHQKPRAVIVPANAAACPKWATFPADPFERALRSELVEVRTKDIAGDDTAARKVEALSGRLTEADELTRQWKAKMDDPEIVDVVADKLRDLAARRKALAAELADAQREAASPVSEAWGEFRTLAGMDPDDDTDELRVRIRGALRRAVESVTCLFAGTNQARVAAVRVQFREGGRHRDYVILHRAARRGPRGGKGRPAAWEAVSFADVGATGRDLRNPADVRKVEALLQAAAGELAG
jgi:hypothetical protein